MNVLSKHDPAYVRAYKGAKAGDKNWNKNFDVNWQLIKKDLKDFDTVADANAKKERSSTGRHLGIFLSHSPSDRGRYSGQVG